MRGPRRVERIGILAFAWVWGTGMVLASQPAVQDLRSGRHGWLRGDHCGARGQLRRD